jgi:CDP-L-myo-inositol myo-inositolphosphotransferase
MKALIIAAGMGTRMNNLTKDRPKALIKLLGLSLIERIILSAKQAGVREFVIVIGYLGEKIKSKLGDGSKYGVKIRYVYNGELKRGNGISVLKAKEVLKEDFILLMSDHIFEPKILEDLMKENIEDGECILCVDRTPGENVFLDEATKVRTVDGRIVQIGKDLRDFNGIDCGIFMCSPSIFDAIEESLRRGDDTLSGGIRVLAEKGRVKIFDVGERFWIDVDTIESYKLAEKLLLMGLPKGTDGPVSRLLNRPISIRLSRFLVKTKITPNLISLLSFLISGISAFFFALGGYLNILIGGILAQLSSIVDGCDGEVARLKFQKSGYGAWFDAVLDRYADALIILGMTYGYWKLNGNLSIWLIGFTALIGSFMVSYTADKYNYFRMKMGVKGANMTRDVRLFLIFIGSILNQVLATLILIALLTNLEAIRRIFVLRNKKIFEIQPTHLTSAKFTPEEAVR